jgi:hypothetical protein
MAALKRQNEALTLEREQLRREMEVLRSQQAARAAVPVAETIRRATTTGEQYARPRRRNGRSILLVLLAAVALGALAYFTLGDRDEDTYLAGSDTAATNTTLETGEEYAAREPAEPERETRPVRRDSVPPPEPEPLAPPVAEKAPDTTTTKEPEPETQKTEAPEEAQEAPKPAAEEEAPAVPAKPDVREPEESERGEVGKFKVAGKAYFHNQPDEGTRRAAFIIHWNNAVLQPTAESNGFVYVVFTNHLGQTSRGWLRKKDLIPVE